MVETSSIALRRETIQRLRQLGKMGESYDDVVTRLLDSYVKEVKP